MLKFLTFAKRPHDMKNRARRILRRLMIFLAVYMTVLLGAFALGLPDRLMLWPQSGPVSAHGATRFTVPWSGGDLELWKARTNREPEAYVLRFHGNGDLVEHWVTSEAQDLPFAGEMWAMNYPGFGGSTGPASLKAIGESALVAYDALAKVAGDKPIFVFGTSMGTTAALRVASARKVAGVFLHNPPALRSIIVGDHGWWNLWLLAVPLSWRVPASLDSVANGAQCIAPAVFAMSGKDTVVRYRYQREVFDAYKGEKHALVRPDANHNDPIVDRAEINQHLLQMFTAARR